MVFERANECVRQRRPGEAVVTPGVVFSSECAFEVISISAREARPRRICTRVCPPPPPPPSLARRQSRRWVSGGGGGVRARGRRRRRRGLSGQFRRREEKKHFDPRPCKSEGPPSGRRRSPAIYIGFIPFPSTGPPPPPRRGSLNCTLPVPTKTTCYDTHYAGARNLRRLCERSRGGRGAHAVAT